MKHTRIINEADIIPNRAAGYGLKDGVLKNQEWVSPTLNTTADGSLYLTVEDIAKWDEALAAEKLLSPAGFEQMWTPVKLNNGKHRALWLWLADPTRPNPVTGCWNMAAPGRGSSPTSPAIPTIA